MTAEIDGGQLHLLRQPHPVIFEVSSVVLACSAARWGDIAGAAAGRTPDTMITVWVRGATPRVAPRTQTVIMSCRLRIEITSCGCRTTHPDTTGGADAAGYTIMPSGGR